jgi:chromosome segregation ATPase
MSEEIQDLKLKVNILEREVDLRGKQIDNLLNKLDIATDKLVQLTVEIRTLNSNQQEHQRNDAEIKSELKLLHSRIGGVHDAVDGSERRLVGEIHKLEERVRNVEQWKSKLMGITTFVASAIGAVAASIITWVSK